MVKDRGLLKVYILKTLAYTLPYHAIAAFLFCAIGSGMEACLYAFVLVIPAALCLLTRLKLRGYVWFVLAHAAILALSLLCGATPTEKTIYAALVLIMCGDSFRIAFGKKAEWEHRTSRLCVLVFAAGYAAAIAFGYPALLPLYIGELVAFLALYFLVQGSFKTWYFVQNSKEIANLPAGQIRRVSTLLLFAFGLLAVGVMLLMAQLPIDLPWAELENALRLAVQLIFTAIAWIYSPLTGQTGDAGQTQSSDITAALPDEAASTSALAQLLEHIFYIVFLALAIAAVVAALVYLFYRLQKRFAERGRIETDVVETVETDVIESGVGRMRDGIRQFFRPESNAQKVRRSYKKYVNRRRGKGETISPAATPAEISRKIGTSGTEADAQIRAVYEKARYSEELVTKDDLLIIKRERKK